jgi:endonuclease/exonuclease/phosphatase family metal-dependent hydrolase
MTLSTLKTMLAPALLLAAAGAAEAQLYVNKPGYFDPSGVPSQPFSTIRGAACAIGSGATMAIGPGVYREAVTISEPMTLSATGLPVTIGQMPAQRTSLRIVTYNTHLFGHDELPGIPRWLDSARAPYIGQVINDDGADIVALQEVWDQPFFQTIASMSGYPHGFWAGRAGGFPRVLGSGLAIYSTQVIQNPVQIDYNESNGASSDALATKGYVQCTIAKDGFSIGFFDTHTQSGNASGDVSARASQLQQLAVSIQVYRTLHPTHPVIVVGDFNVIGESLEHFTTMRSALGGTAQTKDGLRNLPCTSDPWCTSCDTNQLRVYFDPEGDNTRLDYVLYAGSADGSVEIVPTRYERKEFQIPPGFPALSHDGLTTRDLSDHYGLLMDFELHR